MADKNPDEFRFNTPVGRVIHHSLFTKDTYVDEKGRAGTPGYKVLLAFAPKVIEEFEGHIVAACVDLWGAEADDDYWNEKIRSPIKDGDKEAAKREAKGKNGDATRGLLVLQAHTIFNAQGVDADGGVYVCDANAKELDFAARNKIIYNGCHGIANISISPYLIDERKGVTLYLNGFQFMEDGDKLGGADPASLFSPMMEEDSGTKGRRGRK